MIRTPILLSLMLAASSYVHAEEVDKFNFDNIDTTQEIKSTQVLNSLKAPIIEDSFQVPTIHTLNNPLDVPALFVERRTLPMVDIQLTFNAGSARDGEIEDGLYGLSTMATKLLKEGTTQYSATDIITAFEQAGAQFSVQNTRDMFIVKLRSLSNPEKLDAAIKMMIEVINHSTFQPQTISHVVSNTQVGQKQLKENPTRLRDIQFYRTVYKQHPYAEPTTGTIGSNKKIKPSALIKFRDQFLVAQNMNIALTGDLSTEQAQQLSTSIASSIRQGQAAKILVQPKANTDFVVRHIPHQATQAYVSMGHIGTTRNDPDRLTLDIANRMLGGSGFNSVLMQEMRVKRGMTYGVYSGVSFTQSPGLFLINYSTREDQLLESINIAHQALIRFSNEPIDPIRLEETKAGMLRSFPNNYSSNASINAMLGTLGFYRESPDVLYHYAERVKRVTAEQIHQVLKKHIHPERLNIVIASKTLDKAKLLDMLEANLNTELAIKQ